MAARSSAFDANEARQIIAKLCGEVFDMFQDRCQVDCNSYALNVEGVVCAVRDASTDVHRAGIYHSKTGANVFKKSAYVAKWISNHKPIYPTSSGACGLPSLDLIRINATFSVFALDAMIGRYELFPQLRNDLRYCFEFRQEMDGKAIALLLEHALVYSQKYFKIKHNLAIIKKYRSDIDERFNKLSLSEICIWLCDRGAYLHDDDGAQAPVPILLNTLKTMLPTPATP